MEPIGKTSEQIIPRINLKITLICIITDRARPQYDARRLKILLDDFVPPSIMVENGQEINTVLKDLNDKYLKYDHSFVNKSLAGLRHVVGDNNEYKNCNLYEAVYICGINYMPGLNRGGIIYSYQELEERNIQIEEYYEQIISRQF